jgi:hypothetical protein
MTSKAWDPDDGPFIILSFTGDRLDPDPLLELLGPIKSGKPRRKGDPTAKPSPDRPTPRAKTGGCSFWTAGHVASVNPNDHLAFLLDAITPHLEQLRHIIARDGLTWRAVLFDVEGPGDTLPPLDQDLMARAQVLGLKLQAERTWV